MQPPKIKLIFCLVLNNQEDSKNVFSNNAVMAVYKTEITAVGICRADHTTSFTRKTLALTSPTSCGRSVGRVRSRTKATKL
jgi:hypothetical protein